MQRKPLRDLPRCPRPSHTVPVASSKDKDSSQDDFVHLVSQVLCKLLVEPGWVHQALTVWVQTLVALNMVMKTMKMLALIQTW